MTALDSSVDPVADAAPESSPDGSAMPDVMPDTPPRNLDVSFPQAWGGALFANPAVYASIPLRIATTGLPTHVTVALLDQSLDGTDPENDGTYVSVIPIATLADGVYELSATASDGTNEVTAQVALRVSRTGAQLTDYFAVGHTGTPRLHRIDDGVSVSWADSRDGLSKVWLQAIDGAGQWIGSPTALVAEEEDVLYARVAPGNGHFGVLYQRRGTPYRTVFKVVDSTGAEVVAPMLLDPVNAFGNWGGDITYDGTGFVMAWMAREGATRRIHWFRYSDAGQSVGPVVITTSGRDDPEGTFPPYSPVRVACVEDISLVTFVQDYWSAALEIALPKSRVAVVRATGEVAGPNFLALGGDFSLHREAHVWPLDSRFLLLWSARDIWDGEDAPNAFYGTFADATGALDPSRGAGTTVLSAPQDRDEPVLVAHPDHHATMAWLDHRSYTTSPSTARVQLYAGTLTSDLAVTSETVFEHARVIAGLTELRAIEVGGNVELLWLDQRHSTGGTWDQTPELWFDTVWY